MNSFCHMQRKLEQLQRLRSVQSQNKTKSKLQILKKLQKNQIL